MMSNFNTSSLLQALDRIKPDLKPLPQHFITSQDQHTRELYATLLAAVLLSDGQVSEPQSRLFGMLLQSMQLEPVPARFFELAQQLDGNKLKELFKALSTQDQQCALLLDALILARLDQQLSRSQMDLLSELFDCFGLSTDLAGHVIALAGIGLGFLVFDEKLIQSPVLSNRMSKLNPITELAWLDQITHVLPKKGLYFDSATGLMWSRIYIGQQWMEGHPQNENENACYMEFIYTTIKCQEFRLAGFDDWRLPTREELESLITASKPYHNAPSGMLFLPKLNDLHSHHTYWSSSTHNHSQWSVYFERDHWEWTKGIIRYSGVRAVRAGQ